MISAKEFPFPLPFAKLKAISGVEPPRLRTTSGLDGFVAFAPAAVLTSIVSSGPEPPEFPPVRFRTTSGVDPLELLFAPRLMTISGVDAAGVLAALDAAGAGVGVVAGAGAGAGTVLSPVPDAGVLLAWDWIRFRIISSTGGWTCEVAALRS